VRDALAEVGEVLGLQWSDISGNRIKLRNSKAGPRTVWLGDEARALIECATASKNTVAILELALPPPGPERQPYVV
jgi:hypothetical protein